MFAVVAAVGCRSRPLPAEPEVDGGDTCSDSRAHGAGAQEAAPGPVKATATVTTCQVQLPVPSEGACAATAGAGTGVMLRGDVLGPDTLYENGSVLIDGQRIVCVGCDCSGEPEAATATVIDCPGAAISPGLINPHDHITFTEGTPIDHGAVRYDHRHAWRAQLSTPQNPHGTGQTGLGTRWGELRMVMSGVTSMIGSGRATGMVRNLDRLEPRDTSLGFAEVEFQTFPLGDSNRTFHADCDWNFVFNETAVAALTAYLPHIAEGIDAYAAEEFRCQSRSPVGGNDRGARDHTETNTAHIHSIALQAVDYYRMARDNAQIIWSPRSNISLYGHTAQVTTFDRLGGAIALGTDWTYSGSANMLRELACADGYNRDYLDGYFSDFDLWRMATINGAIVAGTEALHGSLEAGKLADIAVFAGSADKRGYRAVIAADNADVELVLLAGAPLFGTATTVEALGQTCDPVDVCGAAKTVCASREFGQGADFATIAAGVAGVPAAYPAIFCAAPAAEPTCVPSRPDEFTGALTSDDRDGDGVANAADNCPDVFNPPRPIDAGAQPDADGDGVGDPCDDTPLLADLDGDTVANEDDNCPFDDNCNQADADGDFKGDACDFCPSTANAGTVCPIKAVTIYDVQNGTIPEGEEVRLENVVVTSVSRTGVTQGFTIQEADGGPYSGVFVFTSTASGRQVGEVVDVLGSIDEFFGVTEITFATVELKGTTTPLAPAELTVAEAADEQWEGVLVRLTDVGNVVSPYACSMDDPACNDINLWQVNGSSGILVFDQSYEGTDWNAHIGQSPITGAMHFRFNRRRIMPRTAADFGP